MHAWIQKIFSGGIHPYQGGSDKVLPLQNPYPGNSRGGGVRTSSGSVHEMNTVVGARGVLRLHDYDRGVTRRGRERHKSSDARCHPV